MPIETEILKDAVELALAARTPIGGETTRDVRQRAEGEFLRALVNELQPMLRQSMRSKRIEIASDAHGAIALKSDGAFVHVDRADQEDVLAALQVLQAEPNLLKILSAIEAELVAANDAPGTDAADVVRLARYSLRVAGAER